MNIVKTKIGTIGISEFVKRQTKKSRFSYYEKTDAELLQLIDDNLDSAAHLRGPHQLKQQQFCPNYKMFQEYIQLKL